MKTEIDPRQMGLFDALEAASPAPMRKPSVAMGKPRRIGANATERPVVLSAREAAHYLGVSVSTLKNWRARKMGPKWTLRGARLVAYRSADLEKYLDENSAKR